jgi:hypothetical protein
MLVSFGGSEAEIPRNDVFYEYHRSYWCVDFSRMRVVLTFWDCYDFDDALSVNLYGKRTRSNLFDTRSVSFLLCFKNMSVTFIVVRFM